ncbi:hypothetical protein ACH9EU_17815 [Kocuria sp. M1R5S2]|uniref:hypothetical protein n=1 Tax=Kocuria rhizosphaerae TaxID=3376285 RepID=UPI0037B58C10
MKNLRKLLTGAAIVGLLAGGSAPAVASGGQHHDGLDDKRIKVLVVKHHKKSGHKDVVEHEEKSLHDAVRFAKHRCEKESWHDLWELAKKTEKYEKKWVEVCTYDHEKNKNVKYHVVYKDNHK